VLLRVQRPRPPSDSRIADPAAFERRWRKRFEQFAEGRDDDAGIAGWSPSGLDARMRRFTGLWRPAQPRERWLDAGCGAGSYARFLLDRGMVVVAADYSFLTLKKAKDRLGSSVAYVLADVRRLPCSPGQFDGVLCFGVLQALAESSTAIDELVSQLGPGGDLWIDALNRRCVVHAWHLLRRRLRGLPPHLRYESPRELRRLLVAAGLVEVRVHWMPILPVRWQRFQRFLESGPIRKLFELLPLIGSLASHSFITTGRKPLPAGAGGAA
jgi:2-polyprenyl-3-methyl-5-hydroxy-6-metoxy-1,4-benzoquinol methylase